MQRSASSGGRLSLRPTTLRTSSPLLLLSRAPPSFQTRAIAMRNLAIFLELFCIVSLSVSAASIDKRIVPPLKCDSNPFHESTLTVIPADQHSDQQYDKHSENMIVPTVPLNSRDLFDDYRNGEAWNHYLYKRSELDVSQEQDFGVGVQDNCLVPYTYKDHGANPTFKFYTCHSDMMGYSKEDDGQGNKVVYGHLRPSDQAGRCVTAATLLRRKERYKVESCEHSDDSGQFLQWWRLDINVKRYEDGTKETSHWLTFVGKPKNSDGEGEYSTLILYGNSTGNNELVLDYKKPDEDPLPGGFLAYLLFGRSKSNVGK